MEIQLLWQIIDQKKGSIKKGFLDLDAILFYLLRIRFVLENSPTDLACTLFTLQRQAC